MTTVSKLSFGGVYLSVDAAVTLAGYKDEYTYSRIRRQVAKFVAGNREHTWSAAYAYGVLRKYHRDPDFMHTYTSQVPGNITMHLLKWRAINGTPKLIRNDASLRYIDRFIPKCGGRVELLDDMCNHMVYCHEAAMVDGVVLDDTCDVLGQLIDHPYPRDGYNWFTLPTSDSWTVNDLICWMDASFTELPDFMVFTKAAQGGIDIGIKLNSDDIQKTHVAVDLMCTWMNIQATCGMCIHGFNTLAEQISLKWEEVVSQSV